MYRRFIKTLSLVLSCVMVICNIQVTHIHAEEQYQHSETATSGSVTMKVEWNDPVLGQPTTFHVSASGGSGIYKFNMEAPSYTNPGVTAYESVADPGRGEWIKYSDECTSQDYTFTMKASGTYNFRFHVMDIKAGVTYLRTNTYIQVSSSDYPSVNSIVQSAVAQCNNETDGSDYQKALWLHDWLLNQLEYDLSLKWSSAESALTRHLGTCQAYESAYAQLLSAAGIENAETRDTYDGHTWNAMKLDGEWYQVDCTWDDSSNNYYNFDQRRLYFGLTDELMAIAHPGYSKIYTVNGYGTRSTSLKNNYFVKSGEAQKWVELYRNRIQNSLNSKQTQFSIQADNSTYPPSIYKIQNGIISYVMNQNEWFVNGKKVNLVATVNDNKFDFNVTYPIECTKHDWDKGKVTTEPTCTEIGIKTYTCKNCATTKTETINALGHDYSNDWTIDKEATCTQEGSKSHHCTRCGAKKDVTVIPKTAHNWTGWSVVEQATTKKEGKERRTCRTCNLKEERSIAKLKVETQSMYRLYNPNSGEHFYTAKAGEKNHLANIGWIYEGIGWNAPKTSDYPVYRLYNGNGGEHHYTMNKAEKDMLVRAGWKYEGIGWYSADPKDSNSIPLLREYNPNAFANNHNYTTSKPEHNWLISLGWKDEGKAWYALN